MTDGVRTAQLADATSIASIHVRSWQKAYRGQLPDAFLDNLGATSERRRAYWASVIEGSDPSNQHVLVAEHDGTVVGFVAFGQARDEPQGVGEVYAIYLDPAHWNHGHGRLLLKTAVAALREDAFREAVLWVLTTNKRARRFYEIAGWQADGKSRRETVRELVLDEVRYHTLLA